MTTSTFSPAARAYLDAVAERLGDLPEDERADVLGDLELHLAELDAADIEIELGTPDDFVREFLDSAGLTPPGRGRPGPRSPIHRLRRRTYDAFARARDHRLVDVLGQRWRSVRPSWVAIRGWLIVACVAVLLSVPSFDPFPIPAIGGTGILGLVSVAALTMVSLRVNEADHGLRRASDRLLSATAVTLVAGVMLSGSQPSPRILPEDFPDEFIDASFTHPGLLPASNVRNIYAYDTDGNPVDVLLFDQEGNPLRLIEPNAGYEAVSWSDVSGPYRFEDAVIQPAVDQYDRPVWNLYPLDRRRIEWSEFGEERLIPEAPPVVGIPDVVDP